MRLRHHARPAEPEGGGDRRGLVVRARCCEENVAGHGQRPIDLKPGDAFEVESVRIRRRARHPLPAPLHHPTRTRSSRVRRALKTGGRWSPGDGPTPIGCRPVPARFSLTMLGGTPRETRTRSTSCGISSSTLASRRVVAPVADAETVIVHTRNLRNGIGRFMHEHQDSSRHQEHAADRLLRLLVNSREPATSYPIDLFRHKFGKTARPRWSSRRCPPGTRHGVARRKPREAL